ncbi:MAG: hypothetical protein IH845_01495 [Nanoarchaeota archaeon]|nr:hypothetical protein [Nanoarchaeota archaeon]
MVNDKKTTPPKNIDDLTKDQKEDIVKLKKIGNEISTIRQKPLLLIFYSRDNKSSISPDDIFQLEKILEANIPGGVEDLDVCIQTLGGNADISYLLAQLIRDYCKKMEIFIPNYAYSGGTLISLSSNCIHLGKTARISPIDLQIETRKDGASSSFALIDIEQYIDFVQDTAKKFGFDNENKVNYVVPLMRELIEDHRTPELGELYRMKDLSKYHAKILLTNYMFKHDTNRGNRSEVIIKQLTENSPSHDFEVDWKMAKGIGLKVNLMDEKIYKLLRILMDISHKLKEHGLICDFKSNEGRKPFFEVFFPDKKEVKK